MHLKAAELIDLLDARGSAASLAHVDTCQICQDELARLRDAMSMFDGAAANVPEPPPAFWTRFDAQLRERIETAGSPRWWNLGTIRDLVRPRVVVPVAAAAIVLAAFFAVPSLWRSPEPPAPALAIDRPPSPSLVVELLSDSMDDDPSLQLIADLTNDVDWTTDEATTIASRGSAEHAITHMSATDLKELQRLLQQEIGT
ncbi:MAG TPA: hypothetical protein VH583_13855 [Vicinamibacterales bacterium]|jgi:hypothetical protein